MWERVFPHPWCLHAPFSHSPHTQTPKPMQPKFILTADDYGPVEFINVGIRKLVREGKINSVQVFSNWGDHLAKLNKPPQNNSPMKYLTATATRYRVCISPSPPDNHLFLDLRRGTQSLGQNDHQCKAQKLPNRYGCSLLS